VSGCVMRAPTLDGVKSNQKWLVAGQEGCAAADRGGWIDSAIGGSGFRRLISARALAKRLKP